MKRFFKKICLVVMAVVMFGVIGFTYGCGIGGGGDDENNAKVLRIGVYNNATETGAIKSVISAFKKKFPDFLKEQGLDDITVKEIQQSSYQTKIQGMARTGTLPDVFLSIDTLAPTFAKQKVSLNLTPYIEASEDYKSIINDMYESMYAQGVFGGEFHMAAREYSRVVIYYNKTLLAEAGLAEPQNDWTWDDFADYATKLIKKENGKVVQNGAELVLNWPSNVLPVIQGLGGAVFNEAGESAVDSTTANAYAELKKLTDSGAVANTFVGIGTSFSNKTIAMQSGTRAYINNMLQYFGKGSNDWGVVCFPDMRAYNGGKAYIGTGTSGYSVSAKSTHKDAAVKFLMFLLSEEGQAALGSTGNFVPVLKSMADSDVWKSELNIGLPEGFNHEAFTYNTDYDLTPFSAVIKDAAKQPQVITQLNLMTECYLRYGVSVKDYGYTDAAGWAKYWNKEINNCF